MRTLVAVVLVLALPAFADDELTPQKAAKVELDQEHATAEVQKKYGNKKPSELSNDERRAQAEDQAAAQQQVLDKNGVDAKSYARYEAKMSRDERASAKQAKQALIQAEKDKAAKAAADAAAKKDEQPAGNGEVSVQRGFSEDKPTVMEGDSDETPEVERGEPGNSAEPQAPAAPKKGKPRR